jgi:hypothetical protein
MQTDSSFMHSFPNTPPSTVGDDSPDGKCVRAHFQGKDREDVDYSWGVLIEDLMHMEHDAFLYFFPAFLRHSVSKPDDEYSASLLSALSCHLSGPRIKRIRFSPAQAHVVRNWLTWLSETFADDEYIVALVRKYSQRI